MVVVGEVVQVEEEAGVLLVVPAGAGAAGGPGGEDREAGGAPLRVHVHGFHDDHAGGDSAAWPGAPDNGKVSGSEWGA